MYENFLFDIPKIFDLCVLYGEGNGPLLTKMVDNIFTQQPKYNDDLRCAIPTVIQVMYSYYQLYVKCHKKKYTKRMNVYKTFEWIVKVNEDKCNDTTQWKKFNSLILMDFMKS